MRKQSTLRCLADGCERPQRTRQHCPMHYLRIVRHGTSVGLPRRAFWDQVQFTDTCWLWLGGTDRNGYGKCGGRLVHRRVYMLACPIPAGLTLDHLCRVCNCVNHHLEPVTMREQAIRRNLAATEKE